MCEGSKAIVVLEQWLPRWSVNPVNVGMSGGIIMGLDPIMSPISSSLQSTIMVKIVFKYLGLSLNVGNIYGPYLAHSFGRISNFFKEKN
jgi:hypothetical protein